MIKFKRTLAALAASAMMFTMSGCSDTRYAMTYNNGEKVNAGVYIYNMYTELSYQLSMAYYKTGTAELDFDSEIEGKKMSEYLLEKARTSTREFAAISYKFNELGLTLTDEELKAVNDNVSSLWQGSGDLMEAEGISKESVRQVLKAQTMRTRLFDYYYADGGVEAVSDADMQKYVEDNYIRYKAIRITKSDAQDETEAADENKENEKVRDDFLAMAADYDYDGFDAVISAYDEYLQAKQDEETSAEQDESTSDILGPVKTEDSEAQVEAPVDDENGLSEEAVLDEDSDTVDVDDILSSSEDAETTDAEETNPNETMFNYGALDEESKDSIVGKLGDFLNGMELNKAAGYEDDSFYYILIKGDVTENSAKYAADNHEDLLQTMKNDDFQAKIDSWIEEIGISENSEAIKRYTAKVVYDKQNEFYNQ